MNVLSAYDSVLGRAVVDLGSVHHVRAPIGADRVGAWNERRMDRWTMDWGGLADLDAMVEVPGRGRVEYRRRPRSWAIVAPGTRFGERLRRVEREREFLWLFFALKSGLPTLAERPFTLVIDDDDRLADHVRAMARAQARGYPGDALIAQGRFLAVLGEVLGAADGSAGDERAPWTLRAHRRGAGGLLAEIDERVLRTPSAPPSRADLAGALRMSESSLSRRFHAETGMTLIERIRWLRVREAKRRLADPGTSVKEVARRLGFSSPFYFSRVFREVAGVTPQQYLRQCRVGGGHGDETGTALE